MRARRAAREKLGLEPLHVANAGTLITLPPDADPASSSHESAGDITVARELGKVMIEPDKLIDDDMGADERATRVPEAGKGAVVHQLSGEADFDGLPGDALSSKKESQKKRTGAVRLVRLVGEPARGRIGLGCDVVPHQGVVGLTEVSLVPRAGATVTGVKAVKGNSGAPRIPLKPS